MAGLLENLFATLQQAGSTPWAQAQMHNMTVPGPKISEDDIIRMLGRQGGGSAPMGLAPSVPVSDTAHAARRPLPAPETEPTAPKSRPDLSPPGPSGAEIVGGILKGLGGVAAPIGDMVAESGARGRQTEARNQTFDWLVSKGVSEDEARLAVTNPAIGETVIKRVLGTGKTDAELATKGLPQGFVWNDPNDLSKGARKVEGVPTRADPIDLMMQREDLRRKQEQEKADNKRLAEIRSQSDVGRETLAKLEQLRAAREGVGFEGGVMTGARTTLGKILPDSIIPGVGLPFIPSREEAGRAEQVQSLATEIQLTFTERTKGAISDREMALFGQATPGMAMSDKGAKNVMDGMEAGALRQRERSKFYDAWRKQHGDLSGADAAWDSFVEAKPILEPDGTGAFRVNRKNVGAWRDFIGGEQQAGGSGAPAAPPPVPNARQAPDGNWYVPDPNRPGKYLRVER